jgi:hypothetical protein
VHETVKSLTSETKVVSEQNSVCDLVSSYFASNELFHTGLQNEQVMYMHITHYKEPTTENWHT